MGHVLSRSRWSTCVRVLLLTPLFLAPAAVRASGAGAGLAVPAGPPGQLAPLPEGAAGIATRYPGDNGIAADPDVLFADGFESARSVDDLWATWSVLINDEHLALATGPDDHVGGTQSLRITMPQQSAPLATGAAYDLPATEDVLFLRWYTKFDAGWSVADNSVHNGATVSARYFVNGSATPGIPADGRNKFLVSFENENSVGPSPGNMNAYIYWPEQGDVWGDHFFPSGLVLPFSVARSGAATFGDTFVPRPDFAPDLGRWTCYEYMVRANTPGERDGRVALWVDGVLIADFPNLRLRDVADLAIDRFDIGVYIADNSGRVNRKWYDDVVAGRSYIGPRMSAGSPAFVPAVQQGR
jgi:hypothetical protein